MFIARRLWIGSLLVALLSGTSSIAFAAASADGQGAPVAFAADSMQNDEQNKTVTAWGNVELEQSGQILKADKIVYNISSDTVQAEGNVVFVQPDGTVHFADDLVLTNEMRDGTVKKLYSTTPDGNRFWAEEGERHQSDLAPKSTTMRNAAYTPCEACKENPEKEPIWQIKAAEVTHKQDEQRIVYRDATFDVMGVPVMYMPYFSHTDGTVDQKSGFLMPSAGFKSDLGLMVSNSYYWAIDPYQDATFGVTAMTEQAPLFFGEYRRRFNNASIEMNGGVTYSDRTESDAGVDVAKGDEMRGHIFAKGLWDINDKWRSGVNVEYASDDQYMRQYDFTNKDVLENELYVERFSGRDYAVARLLSFQDIRVAQEQADQPNVLPEVNAGFLGAPGEMLGGRWSVDVSALGLQRESSGQDLNRVVLQTGWQRRLVSDFGLLTTVDLKLRGDGYYVNDRDIATTGSNRSGDGGETRAFAQAHIVTSYPVVKTMEKTQVVIEPIAALTAAPNINTGSSNIPNEDSLDVQLDASNLFEPDRFPGLDRIEDKSRVTYGIRTGLHDYEGSKAEFFIGQSYRFDNDDNPFPDGSGLSDKNSDLVGQISASYLSRFSLDYRFQLDNDTYASQRHELSGYLNIGRAQFGTQYLYAKGLENTSLSDDREQISGYAGYSISDQWQTSAYLLQDLGDDPGLRKATLGLTYLAQCFNITGQLSRNLTSDSSGESSTEATFRIGLKNLGEFSTSGISLDGLGSDDNNKTLEP